MIGVGPLQNWVVDVLMITDIIPFVVIRLFHHSWLTTRFVTRQVTLVEQEIRTLPEHLNSSWVFSGVCISRSLLLCVVFCGSLFVLLSFLFCYCIVCLLIYGFWLPLWCVQTSLAISCPHFELRRWELVHSRNKRWMFWYWVDCSPLLFPI